MWCLRRNTVRHSLGPILARVCAAGLNVNVVDSQGRTALHEFPLAGVNAVKPYIENDDPDKDSIDTLYHSVLSTIINSGADIHVKDTSGRTPLHLVVIAREVVMVELLMEHGLMLFSSIVKAFGQAGLTAIGESHTALSFACGSTNRHRRNGSQWVMVWSTE